jgi:UPF0716 family protein affecting phage T7 exclusion
MAVMSHALLFQVATHVMRLYVVSGMALVHRSGRHHDGRERARKRKGHSAQDEILHFLILVVGIASVATPGDLIRQD